MLEPWDWTERDLQQLVVDQIGESLTLDYKESGALQRTDGKKNELSKDVSAFANSAGGVLVYGMKENGHIPVGLDDGLDPAEISKEWLEQVINSRIERRIAGVRVRQIPLTSAQAERVAYVVYIPASTHAPHMAADHRYYKRFNFESVPMEDYEVRDVSRRYVDPDLRVGLIQRASTPVIPVSIGPTVEVYIENISIAPADFALITFHVTTSNSPVVAGIEKSTDSTVVFDGIVLPVQSYKLEWRGALRLPLMHGARCRVTELSISLADTMGEGHVFWEVFAPGAESRQGAFILRRETGTLQIVVLEAEWRLSMQPVWQI